MRITDLAPLPPNAQLDLLLDRLIAAKVMHRRTNIQAMRGIVQVFATNINTSYVPAAPYGGTLHLVKVPQSRGADSPAADVVALDGEECDWRKFAPAARYWLAPGNHMTMLGAPHVARLGAWLGTLLGGAR